MALEFSSVDFRIGEHGAEHPLRWCSLMLKFRDTEIGHVTSVEAHILVTVRPELSIAEVGAQARGRAMTILREALAALEANEITDLENRSVPYEPMDSG
jgi:hypothetical protein